jgi:hypothetical protein
VALVVDAESERVDVAVVYLERGHAHALFLKDNAFRDVLRFDACPFFRLADLNVSLVRLLEVRHHRGGALRSKHPERTNPPAVRVRQKPGQPQVGDADGVVRMQMGDEEFDGAEWDAQLPEARRARAAAVEHEPLRSGFHQNAGSEPVRARVGRSRTQQDDSEVGRV